MRNQGFDVKPKFQKAFSATTTEPKCSLTSVCPSDHLALKISSGAANVVGPKICFDGKIIMSNVLNNVGPGLNIVVVDGKNGKVEKFGYLNMNNGKKEDILAYLKEIKPGMIVLVASFEDVTPKMTDEMKEVFVRMGSTLIKSVKRRDNWVFVGRAGTESKSLFEKQSVNDEKTNIYEGWPEIVEIGGCIPRTQNTP
ncbi:protein FAM3C [Anoplopoma fimbria]|uniref:protein FAM3C n=1 Tax=Anoplopoma fimbria TaxID=229290 RepID=UPI0023EAE161|nr:protein FAM3C [Anoplopoma fimbria]